MFVVITYDYKYRPIWQIIEKEGTVLSYHKTRKEALKALTEKQKEANIEDKSQG